MPTYRSGRHELGQNFLTDNNVIDAIIEQVSRTEGPILEIGPGDGALTFPLEKLQRPLTAIEIDRRYSQELQCRIAAATNIIHGDFLQHPLPIHPYTLVGNLPFHQTTAMLRRILHADTWTDAILLTQWEVARRRAAVGGATMMTAQWWPWYEFELVQRVPAAAFTPRPGVDGGLMTLSRRTSPLVEVTSRARYSTLVHAVYTGKGRGIHEILPRLASGAAAKSEVRKWLKQQRFRRTDPLPRDITAPQWAEIFAITHPRSRR